MPRNGSGVYSLPANTRGGPPNTPISSTKYNTLVDDLASDNNAARPVVAGGTGGATVEDARDNLGVENKTVYAAKSGAYTALETDNAAILRFTAAATLSLTAAATLGANWHIIVIADGGDVTVDPNSSETIDGASTLVVSNGYSVEIVCDGSAFFTDKMATTLKALAVSAPAGHLYGLTLSNNVADATNDIDIAAGSAASDAASPAMMTLAAALTKRLDGSWAVGTNQGGLDTGSIANTTYYVWLIRRSDTGVVDALFSTSATSPTMPASYDQKRRIGAFKRESGSIWSFKQTGDLFELVAPSADVTTATTSAVLRTLRVPVGLPFVAHISVSIGNTAGAMSSVNHWNPALGATVPSARSGLVQTFVNTPVVQAASAMMDVVTNSSAQIYNQANGTALTSYEIVTLAYWDTRGRF